MRVIKTFLSSSSELEADRKEFELFISRENRALVGKGIFLELVVWEDFIESMSQTRLQEEYNKAILHSDIFVMMLFTKVGSYVLEEFEQAFGAFTKTGRPLIFTYFKDAPISLDKVNPQAIGDLFAFKEQLQRLGHFYTTYRDVDSLKHHFSAELDKLVATHVPGEDEQKAAVKYLKNKVFISYSHRDKPFLDRLLVHLSPLREEGLIDLWDDTKLRPGDDWKKEIEEHLRDTGFAILLVSADYLASEFIIKNELPPLLTAAERMGTRITPIVVKPCRFTRDKRLSIYQAVNSPNKPLSGRMRTKGKKYTTRWQRGLKSIWRL